MTNSHHEPEEPSLPSGWERHVDPGTGKVSYYHKEANTKLDEPPRPAPTAVSMATWATVVDPEAGKGSLAAGWEVRQEPVTGEVFYFSSATNTLATSRPEEESNTVSELETEVEKLKRENAQLHEERGWMKSKMRLLEEHLGTLIGLPGAGSGTMAGYDLSLYDLDQNGEQDAEGRSLQRRSTVADLLSRSMPTTPSAFQPSKQTAAPKGKNRRRPMSDMGTNLRDRMMQKQVNRMAGPSVSASRSKGSWRNAASTMSLGPSAENSELPWAVRRDQKVRRTHSDSAFSSTVWNTFNKWQQSDRSKWARTVLRTPPMIEQASKIDSTLL